MRRYALKLILLLCCLSSFPLMAKESRNVLSDKDQFKFDYYFLDALRMKEKGDLRSAGDLLYHCHLINPQSASVYFELATLASKMQQYASASQYAQRAVTLNSTNLRYRRAWAELSAYAEDYATAIDQYNYLIKHDEKHATNYYAQLAGIYTVQKNYEQACICWDNYAKKSELTKEIATEKFKLYLSAGNSKKAFKQIDQLINSFPNEYSYVAMKADMYLYEKDTASAEKTFQKSLKKAEDNVMLQMYYATYLHNTQQDGKSAEYFKKAYYNPNATFDQRCSILMNITSDSITTIPDSVFQNLIAEYPEEYLPTLCYGLHFYAKKDSTCYDYFKKSLALNPNQEEIWKYVISFHAAKNELDSTIAVCNAAVTNFPDNADFLYSLGFAQHSQGNDSLALATMRQSVNASLNKHNLTNASHVLGIMGDIYFQLNDSLKAFASYDSSLVYNPQNYMVMNNYAYYLSLNNQDLKRAEMMSGKTVKADPNSPVFLDTYAWICFKQGEYAMAHLYIEQAYNHGGNTDPELTEHYGDILFKIGEDKSQYLPMWKKALEMREKEEHPEEYKGLETLKKKVQTETYAE